MIARMLTACIITAMLTAPARAQEEAAEPLMARTRVNANVRLEASLTATRLRTLPENTLVSVVGTHGTWRRVRTNDGSGWVAAHLLQPMQLDALALLERRSGAAEACATSLDDCPDTGCSDRDEEELLHRRKRRVVSGRAIPLAMQDFIDLQKAADRSIGQAATVYDDDMRALQRMLRRDNAYLGEGKKVQFFGYVLEAKASGAENVNCNLSGSENADFHINVADGPGRTPYKSIVVEMIPQERDAGWTVAKLNAAARKRLPIVVVGQLFYDNKHLVRDGKPENERRNQSKRLSLWEVHPVSEFWVCAEGGCEPADDDGWVALAEWEP